MKSLIIIVPGAKTKHPFIMRKWLKLFYDYFGISTKKHGREWTEPLKEHLNNTLGSDVMVFNWTGGISRVSVYRSAKKLVEFILQNNKYDQIKFFCKSLGGNVADIAINKLKDTSKITKILYVGVPHQASMIALPAHIKMINVYSSNDTYLDFTNRTLYLGLGKKHIKNARNIVLDKLKHSGYIENVEIQYHGQIIKTFDLYGQLLK